MIRIRDSCSGETSELRWRLLPVGFIKQTDLPDFRN